MAVQQTTTQTILPEWYTNYAQQLMGRSLAASEEPYQAYGLPRIAGFTPEQEQGFQTAQQQAGAYKPYMGYAQNLAQSGGAGSSLTAAQPYFGTAGQFAQQGGMGSALATAQPYVQRGAGSFTDPGVAQQYMNPYTQQVVSGIGDIAARNLREKILPEVNRTFIGGGTFGGSRSAEFTQRAIRDAQSAALAQQVQALQQGYDKAADLYGTEAGRALTAAGEVGRLASTDYSRMIDTSRSLADIGQSTGQLAGTDYSRQLEAARTMGDLGANAQALGLQEAKAYGDIGAQRQNLAQRSADLAYQDFLEQRDYPFTQLQKAASIAGTPSATGQTQVSQTPGPSGTSQVLGTLATIGGILGKAGVFKHGGEVKSGLGWLKDKR